MVTVILLALSTSVGSVISVIPISDDMFAGYPTITTDATFISVILASATTCYRKERKGRGSRGRGRGGADEEGRVHERVVGNPLCTGSTGSTGGNGVYMPGRSGDWWACPTLM